MADKTDVWVVDETISSSTTLLYGEAKVGKSFLVSALITSLTTGRNFLDRPAPVDRDFSVAEYGLGSCATGSGSRPARPDRNRGEAHRAAHGQGHRAAQREIGGRECSTLVLVGPHRGQRRSALHRAAPKVGGRLSQRSEAWISSKQRLTG
ncbi:AAA family ATPase [Actinomadura madurae]